MIRILSLFIAALLFTAPTASAVTIGSSETDYVTSSNITESATSGLYSNFAGTSSSSRTITNASPFTITTSSGSGNYGIKVAQSYNIVTNASGASIVTTGNSGRGISVFDDSTVINAGSISTAGSTAYGIRARTNSNVTNSGSITTTNTSSAHGIYLDGDNATANNSGSIATKVYGIYSDSNEIQITNSGTITTTTGSSAHGIFVSAASASTASSTSFSTINNSGTITSNANGIYTKDSYTEITNSGTITSSSSASSYGIKVEGSNSTITNSGNISSTTYAIYNSGTGAIINNSGNLSGGIVIGDGTLNISGGSISGAVDGSTNLGDVNINSNFTQTAAFTNLDNLTINSSNTLTSAASINANNIFIASGANLTLTSGSSVSGSIRGTSDSVGTLNISGTDFVNNSDIGLDGKSLANINIFSGSSLTTSGNIFATDIALSGTLNLIESDDQTISGNLTGSGSGTINVGTASQIISGNLTLNNSDSLATSLGSGTAGNLTISGLANIDSEAKLKITPTISQGYIVDGTEFTLLSGGSGSSVNQISDANISVNGNGSNIYGLLKFTTQSAGDSLILTVNRLSAASVTTNKNAQNIYTNLNNIGASSSGKLSDFQGYLDSSGFTGEALTAAIKQAAPQSTKTNLAVSSDIALNSIKTSENRLIKLRENLTNGFWVETLGNSATQNAIKDDDGYKANSMGLIFGADKELSDESTAGAALSYVRSRAKSLSLKRNMISSSQLSLYRGQDFEKYFVDSMFGFAWNNYSSNRAITALDLNSTARYSGQTYLAKIKIGQINKLKRGFTFMPEASLNALHNSISGYKENGADELDLEVSGVSANMLEGRIGANLGWSGRSRDFPEFKKLGAVLRLSYGHRIINDKPTTTASFKGQSLKFDSQISQIDKQSLRLGTSFDAYHNEDTLLSTDYDFEKRSTYSSHLLTIKIRQAF